MKIKDSILSRSNLVVTARAISVELVPVGVLIGLAKCQSHGGPVTVSEA